MQGKTNLGTASLTNERQRSFFQIYIFDPFNYTTFFDVSTEDMVKNLADALWPFFPEN